MKQIVVLMMLVTSPFGHAVVRMNWAWSCDRLLATLEEKRVDRVHDLQLRKDFKRLYAKNPELATQILSVHLADLRPKLLNTIFKDVVRDLREIFEEEPGR